MSFSLVDVEFQETYDDADKLIDDMQKAMRQTKNILYRGIQFDEEKYPTLMRVRYGNTSYNLCDKEMDLLEEFRRQSISLLTNTYGALDLICAAQHFGIPTRLLDWTYSPLVALYFSLSALLPIKREGFEYRLLLCDQQKQLIFSDLYSMLTMPQVGFSASDRRLEIFKGFVDCIAAPASSAVDAGAHSKDALPSGVECLCQRVGFENYKNNLNNFIVLDAGNSNPRINAQKGVFVIPRKLNRQSIDGEYTAAGTRTIKISESIRKETLKKLDNLGFSRLHLFFDLQNICQHIKENAIDKHTEGNPA